MSRVDVNVKLNADLSEASSVTAALDAIAAKGDAVKAGAQAIGESSQRASGQAVTSFQAISGSVGGVDAAMRGGSASVMGMAQALIYMVRAISASNPVFLAITIALLAINKVLGVLTEKYNKQSEASKKSADEAAEFSKSLNALRAKQQEVTFSIEHHVAWVAKLGQMYEHAAGSVDKMIAAWKASAAARRELERAGVDVEEAAGLERAGRDTGAAERVRAEADARRAAIAHSQASGELSQDRRAIEQKISVTQRNMRDLAGARGASPEIEGARAHLAELQKQLVANRQNHDVYLEILRKIDEQEKTIAALTQKERERVDAIDEQLSAKNGILNALRQELRDNAKLTEALDLQYQSEQKRLALQLQENAAKARELALTRESAAAQAALQTEAQRAASDRARDMAAASRAAEALAKEEARMRERVLSPAAGKQQDRAAREASREAARLDKRLAAADDALARGARGKWIEDVQRFRDVRKMAQDKKMELAQLETAALRAQVEVPTKLAEIKTMLEKTLSAAA